MSIRWPRENDRPPTPDSGRLDVLIAAPASLFILFIIVPLIALIWRAAVSGSFLQSLSTRVVADAVRLTLETTACTLLLVLTCGTPLAYLLAVDPLQASASWRR